MKPVSKLLLITPIFLFNSVGCDSTLKFKGLDPVQQELYNSHLTLEGGEWTCLSDTHIKINITQINDGICDCPDGSDEPGTSACNIINESLNQENSLFYCVNDGFIPRYIDKSSVGDGVCDCCDCSDESLDGNGVNICSKVDSIYHRVIDKELGGSKLGKLELLSLFEDFDIDINDLNKQSNQQANLKVFIQQLTDDFERNQQLYKSETDNFMSKLKQEDPTLYQYETINTTLIIDYLNPLFDDIALSSKMYTDLVSILGTLAGTFNPSLNDKVVNDNVYMFQDKLMELNTEKKVSINSGTDNELREQLIDYFTKELPELFWKGKSKDPSEYVIKKARFVEWLLQVKVEYTETVFEYIDDFSSIMKDITDNHNVNVQDKGVKEATKMYKDYLKKYANLLKKHKVILPKPLAREVKKLLKVIENIVPKILDEKDCKTDEDTETGINERRGIFGFMSNLLNINGTDVSNGDIVDVSNKRTILQALKTQIVTRKNLIDKIRNDLIKAEKEYERLEEMKNTISEEGRVSNEKMLRIEELIKLLPVEETCTSSLINGYKYEICLNSDEEQGYILQIENKPNGNKVLIGVLEKTYLDESLIKQNYIDKIKVDNLDEDIDLLEHLTNSTKIIGDKKYYLGPLESVNNGYIVKYGNGDQCWNGPLRSATVLIKCSDKFRINSVNEMTKCNYQFDVEGPWGCNF
ncbi:Gtb1p PWA37_000151 [Arxiozyma heterogenica]|uniref:Gtb1p n=1 Tax=Arxiozyma heterogenica TaxID=278026 RepID=UPI002F1BCA58